MKTERIVKNFLHEQTSGGTFQDEEQQWSHLLSTGKSYEVKRLVRKLKEGFLIL